MPNVTLYQMPQVIKLTEPGAQSYHAVVNKTDFHLFKNVTNEVEFLIKDVDRKPVNVTNRNLSIFVVDPRTQKLVIQSNLIVINGTRGHCRMTLSPKDVVSLENGFFRFSVTIDRVTTVNNIERVDTLPIFTDQNWGLNGHLEVLDGPVPNPQPVIEIEPSVFQNSSWGDPILVYQVAEMFPGAAQKDNQSGHHTLALYLNNFSGQFWVEASLENSPPSQQSDWFAVETENFNQYTGVKGISFTGSYMWIRVYYRVDPLNTGNLIKALLKN